MLNLTEPNKIPKRWYRPEQRLCPVCQSFLKRHHIRWHKQLTFLSGPEQVVSWVYRCPDAICAGASTDHSSLEAESLHLKHRRYSREVVVHVGHRRFWLHQTTEELHDWLAQDLKLAISERQVLNLVADFLALLRAAQPAHVRQKLQRLSDNSKYLTTGLVIKLIGCTYCAAVRNKRPAFVLYIEFSDSLSGAEPADYRSGWNATRKRQY